MYIFALFLNYTNMYVDDDIKSYDVQIESDYYNNDYDNVDFENQSEPITESDILFE